MPIPNEDLENEDTTFVIPKQKDYFEVFVGDYKQPVFHPRVKLERWDNETNFSVGVQEEEGTYKPVGDDVEWEKGNLKANFKQINAPSLDNDTIDYIQLGAIEPKKIPAEFELGYHTQFNRMTVTWYWNSEPSFGMFGLIPMEDFIDPSEVTIPVTRSFSFPTDPSYADEGLMIVNVHIPDMLNTDAEAVFDFMNEAKKQVFKEEYDIDLYELEGAGKKLFYKNPEGEDIKISSPQMSSNGIWDYVNIDCDYTNELKNYNLKMVPSVEIEKQDQVFYGYGIKEDYPEVTNDIVDKYIKRFVQLLDKPINERALTTKENTELNRVANKLDNDDWKLYGKRDFPMGVRDKEEGYEFDVTFKEKPTDNQLVFSIRTKNLNIYKQTYTQEELNAGNILNFDVINSFAVYNKEKDGVTLHAGNEKAEKYQVGKAFHIYRPILIDADGDKIFAEMEIDVVNETLTVTMPQEFLDNAKYPLTLDPTLGYTVAGSSAYSIMYNIAISKVPVPSGYTANTGRVLHNNLDSIITKHALNTTSSQWKMATYSSALTLFTGSIEQTGAGQNSNPAGWKGTFFVTGYGIPYPFGEGITYWAGAWSQLNIYGAHNLSYDSAASGYGVTTATGATPFYGYTPGTGYNGWPNPHPGGTFQANKYSIYFTYIILGAVDTDAVSDIDVTTATANGDITDLGGQNLTGANQRGFVYGTTSQSAPGDVLPADSGYENTVTQMSAIIGKISTGAYTAPLTGLQKKTTYYIRAWVANWGGNRALLEYGFSYGDEVSFTTDYKPTLSTSKTLKMGREIYKTNQKFIHDT